VALGRRARPRQHASPPGHIPRHAPGAAQAADKARRRLLREAETRIRPPRAPASRACVAARAARRGPQPPVSSLSPAPVSVAPMEIVLTTSLVAVSSLSRTARRSLPAAAPPPSGSPRAARSGPAGSSWPGPAPAAPRTAPPATRRPRTRVFELRLRVSISIGPNWHPSPARPIGTLGSSTGPAQHSWASQERREIQLGIPAGPTWASRVSQCRGLLARHPPATHGTPRLPARPASILLHRLPARPA
jgi:hypothetical protein